MEECVRRDFKMPKYKGESDIVSFPLFIDPDFELE